MMRKPLVPTFLAVIILVCMQGCATISPFDQFAYAQVTAVKVDVLELMDHSVETYQSHEKQVGELNNRILKIIEYEKHRPKNGVTVKMWNKLYSVDSTGQINNSIIPSYWAKWKKEKTERLVFIEQAKEQVAAAFDLIAQLESKKIKPTDRQVTNFISKP